MRHEEFEEALYSYYDGELSGEKSLEVREHLKACAECSRRLEHWSKLAQAFFAPEKIEVPQAESQQRVESALPGFSRVPQDFALKVMERLREPEPAGLTAAAGVRVLYRWLFPAFGLGLASYLFLAVLPETSETVSAEDLLLANGRGAVSELAFLPSAPGRDEILGYALENP